MCADFKLLLLAFVLLILAIRLFMWYNNGEDAALGALSKKVKLVLSLVFFVAFAIVFNWSFGNHDVLLTLFNNCISAFIGFMIAFMFKNRLI